MVTKVSVIVPAYKPGDGIDRVIASMERQTLPQSEFEVIIIDDGSPDDTFSRLEKIRDTHSNIRIERIENSGWASRPRNIGIDMARGEYVLFMDHDDYLYPDALRSSWRYATENAADVLSPKESKTSDVGWGMGNFTRNVPNARASHGIASLLPMMPHKFYRRDFLNEHGIRFPEGRRMLWEDVYFNVEAFRYSQVISILAETPVYRWVQTGSNNSATYGPDSQEFWDRLIRLLDFIVATLPGDEFEAARNHILLQLFRTRVLGRFDEQLGNPDGSGTPLALENATRVMMEYVPESLEFRLGKVIRARSYLLRASRVDLMRELRGFDIGTAGITHTDNVRWEDGALVIDAMTRWTTEAGEPLKLQEKDGRILRRLTPALEAFLPPQVLDVTEDVQLASTKITVRSRADYVTWALPTETTVTLESHADSAVEVVVNARTTLDIDRAAFGRPLMEPIWDFHGRDTLLGTVNHRGLRANIQPQAALVHGRAAIAYENNKGMLSLDVAQKLRSVVTDGGPAVQRARFTRVGKGLTAFTLPLEAVHVVGRTRLSGEVGFQRLGGRVARVMMSERVARIPKFGPFIARALGGKPGAIEGTEEGARLTGAFRAFPGVYTLTCRFGGRTAITPIRLRVSVFGRPSFTVVDS